MSYTVKQARIGKNMTIEQMAEALGMCANTYSKLEKNPMLFTIELACRFARVTGYSLDDISFLPSNSN